MLTTRADNWLHIATHAIDITHYDPTSNYTENQRLFPVSEDPFQAGFRIHGPHCNATLHAPLPQNISDAPLPCSLNETNGLTNIAFPSSAYLALGTGITQISSGFNGLNFSLLHQEEIRNTVSTLQIVSYDNAGVSHSLFFYPDAAAEYNLEGFGRGKHYGIDYVANTTSMVTECTYKTQDCNIHATNSSRSNSISIPFHCYDDFSGDLGQTPATGHERAQGWNMSFYQTVDGKPRNVPVQAQSNPFHFYVATAVNSIDFEDFLSASNLPEGSRGNGSLVDAGRGFTAFALDCQATIYDVTFSLVNGSLAQFNASVSSPAKASIIKAPLQIGFGQYHLYQAASLAVLANNDSVASTIGKAFSQTGMALASGVFDFDNNIEQRFRWIVSVTRVPKAPFFYLVFVCLLYSFFGIVMTALAFYLRRTPRLRGQQAKLMVEWGSDLLDMGQHEKKKKKDAKSSERTSPVGSDDGT